MRLLKLGVYSSVYLQRFYEARPETAAVPYDEHLAALLADRVGSSDFWTRELDGLGYETREVIANAEPAQKRWALEHGVRYDEGRWIFEIAAAQIEAYRPDVLFIADFSTFDAPFIRSIRRTCPSIRLVAGWCGAPFGDPSVFREWDIVFSCVPELVEHFRDGGHFAVHLNHAFEARVLEDLDLSKPPGVDFSFLGSVVKIDEFHLERERILRRLVEITDVQVWSDIGAPSARMRFGLSARRLAYGVARSARALGVPPSVLAATPLVRRVARWTARPSLPGFVDREIARRARPALFGRAMFQGLRDSRVTLNTHIDVSPRSASNMRLFEATGVGACLITDWKANLSDLFEPDAEVLTYRTPDECAEKVRYVLDHEDERQAIAAAGQRRTLRDHNFEDRAARLDESLRAALPASAR